MVTIAIVGILAAIAIPEYENYIVNAKAADVAVDTHQAVSQVLAAVAATNAGQTTQIFTSGSSQGVLQGNSPIFPGQSEYTGSNLPGCGQIGYEQGSPGYKVSTEVIPSVSPTTQFTVVNQTPPTTSSSIGPGVSGTAMTLVVGDTCSSAALQSAIAQKLIAENLGYGLTSSGGGYAYIQISANGRVGEGGPAAANPRPMPFPTNALCYFLINNNQEWDGLNYPCDSVPLGSPMLCDANCG
jgi:hypothetical protein